jgi:trimeric autotransporter adhesin
VTDYGASVSTSDLIDVTQTNVSADGLDTTVSEAFTSASLDNPGTWDQIIDDLTTVNADGNGSLSETIKVTDGAGNLLQNTEKDTSANRRKVTTTTTLGTTGLVKTVETVTTQDDGSVQDQTVDFDQLGGVIGATVTTTTADGLSKTVQQDIQGQSAATYTASGLAFDSTTTDTTAINADGSRTETIKVESGDGGNSSILLSKSSTLTSANGLTVTTTANPYATLHFATQTIDTVTLNADGSKTEDVKEYSYSGAPVGTFSGVPIDETRTTTSGLATTVLRDLDGDGVFDQSSTDVTTINADGSQTEVVTDYTGDTTGTVRDETITHSGIIVSGVGLETIITRQSNGSVPIYQTETIMPSVNGDVTDTTLTYDRLGGTLELMTQVTTSANGLVETTGVGVDGHTSPDFSTKDETALEADGSRVETVTRTNQAGLISETVTTTTANGLSTTTQADADGTKDLSGAAVFKLTTADNTVLNADGSRTEIVTTTRHDTNQTISQTTTTTSADKQTVTTDRYLDETPTPTNLDQSEVVQTQDDGSTKDTTTTYGPTNALLGTVTKTTSGNGLSTSIQFQNASNTVVDTQRCTITYDANGDGGDLEDCEDTDVVNTTTTLTSSVKTQTSGNQQNKTITMLLSGALAATNTSPFSAISQDTISIADSGVRTETVTDTLNGASSANDTTTTVTSADGLVTTTSTTLAGGASAYIKDVKTTNLDGSKTETTTYYNPSSLRSSRSRRPSRRASTDGRSTPREWPISTGPSTTS